MSKPLIGIAIALGVLSTGVTYWLISRGSRGGTGSGPTSAVALTRDLPAHALVRAEDVELTTRQPGAVPANAYIAVEQVVGKLTAKPLTAGTTLQQDLLLPAPSSDSYRVSPGRRAFAITVEPDVGASRVVEPDDLVDILYLDDSLESAETLAQNIRVLRVGNRPDGKDQSKAPVVEGNRIQLVVEVTPEQAAQLLAAHTTGILTVSLRNRSDSLLVPLEAPVRHVLTSVDEPPQPEDSAAEEPPKSPSNEVGNAPAPMPVPTFATSQSPEPPPGKRVTVYRGLSRENVEVEE